MRIRSDYLRQVRELENVWIPLPDGGRLAAKIWLPEDAEAEPVPAILEYIPYRKNDGTAARDAAHAPLLRRPRLRLRPRRHARQRRLGRRRCSTSTCAQEQDDALEVHRLARGAALVHGRGRHDRQLLGRLQRPAGRGPPAAGAEGDRSRSARPTTATRTTSTTWAAACSASTCSPGPRRCSPSTRARPTRRSSASAGASMWLERLEDTPPFVEAWLTHQRRDAFWKHGSVCEDFAAIECAGLRGRRLGGRLLERRSSALLAGCRARARA